MRRTHSAGEGLPFLGTSFGDIPHDLWKSNAAVFRGPQRASGRSARCGSRSKRIDLRSHVLKAPHHGSADFSADFLKAVEPVVSVISSGDESSLKEYIHPHATLMGALGKYSRGAPSEPLIFVTELVAFFTVEGYVDPEAHKIVRGKPVIEDGEVLTDPKAKEPFFAFSRAAFGLVKIRTDGERLLMWTNSGQTDLKEAYAFDLSSGDAVPVSLLRV